MEGILWGLFRGILGVNCRKKEKKSCPRKIFIGGWGVSLFLKKEGVKTGQKAPPLFTP
jgi:hypothetical protein